MMCADNGHSILAACSALSVFRMKIQFTLNERCQLGIFLSTSNIEIC